MHVRFVGSSCASGITTTYDYDGMSRLTRLKDATVGSTLLDRQYSYSTANQISGITEPSRTRTFGYDNIDRLTSATDSSFGSESYAFDAVGNRTSSHLSASYTTDPFNRTTAATGIAQTFDSNGNTIIRSVGGTNWTFSWDRENRLTSASSASASVDYVYDALGRRVSRSDGSNTVEFTHDGEDVVLDDSTASGITKYQNGPGIDNKLSVKQGSTTSYILADHLGSTNALTDSTGAITASQSYDSFGNGSSGSFPSRYQFTGREYDPTIGLQYYRARFYDPNLGRFISEDPIGFAGGDVNLYGYVFNNPTRFGDPTGMIHPALAAAGIGAAAGAIGVILAKGLINVYCNRGFFYGANSLDYWKDVGIGAGGGAVFGALLTTSLGATAVGVAAIGAGTGAGQYGVSVAAGRTTYSHTGFLVSVALGATGGLVGGTFRVPPTQPVNPLLVRDPAERLLIEQGNRIANNGVATAVAVSSSGRTLAGGIVSNSPTDTFCGCGR